MKGLLVLLALMTFSCGSGTSDRIEIPASMDISVEGLLSQIMDEASNQPENERLLRQELYYCEQLGWPKPCDETLLRAKRRWGFSEKLIDQMVAYHLKHTNYMELEAILKGAVETRPRLEAKIRIKVLKNEDASGLITRYLDHHTDKEATLFALNQYLETSDTLSAVSQFETLRAYDQNHELLRSYYPILMERKKYAESIYIINNQLVKLKKDTALLFDLAISLYGIKQADSARNVIKKIGGSKANQQLVHWYRSEKKWDSTLFYLDKLIIQTPNDPTLLLAKAEVLESKQWITRSLPYYEQVLLLNPLDSIMEQRVEIVRRKVAYLRRIKEQKRLPPILNLKRKTTTDN